MVNTRLVRVGNSSQPLGRGQVPSNLPPHLPPPIPNIFPPVDHAEGGDENQPHNSAHNSASTANQDVVAAQLAAMQQQFGVFQPTLSQLLARNNPGNPLINLLNPVPQPPAPQQNPELVQHAPAFNSLEKLVAEQRDAPPPHHATDSIPHPLNTNITLEPYPAGFKIPQLETYDRTKDPDDHLHAFYSYMQAQNAFDALMCKIFPSTLRGNAQTWYYSLPLRSISSYTEMASAFATKFSSRRLIKKTTSELMQIKQRDGESLKNYMSRFNDAILEVSSFDQAVGIAAMISSLNHERFRDNLIKHPATTFSEVNDRPNSAPPQQSAVVTPHNDPLVTSVMINNCDVQRVLVNTESALDIMYFHCFESLGLDPALLQRYDGLIYGFNNQPIQVEGVLTLYVAFGSGRTYVTPSVRFLVVKMASSFNVVIGRPTLTEIRAVEVARYCYITSVTQPKKGKDQTPEAIPQRIPDNQQVMGVEIVDNRPEDETRATLVEDVEEEFHLQYPKHKLSTNPLKKPVTQKRRLFGGERLKVIKEEVEKLLQASFVRKVNYCEWVANLVLVKKANGKWQMYIDYTNLNQACPKDCYPMPSIDKLVEAASGNERLSLLDAYSRNLEVYIDDIVVKSLKAEDHLADLDETFNNLKKNRMRLNPAKCTFGMESGKFLGFMVSRRRIEVNPEKIRAIAEMEPPKSVKDIQRLTRRVAAFHRFISKSADKCLLFFKIMRSAAQKDESGKQKKFEWNQACQAAFKELKSYLSSPPLLTKAIDGEILYLYLGISDEATSLVLEAEAIFLVTPNHCLHRPTSSTDSAEARVLRKIKWAVELGEFEITFQQRSAIRAQALGLGAGALLIGPDGYRSEQTLKFNFDATNNIVEYEALLLGLQRALELKISAIQVYSDSQLVVNQINSICEVVNPVMVKYVTLVAELKCKFQKFCLSKIPRTENEQANSLSKFASDSSLSSKSVFVEVLDEPSFMKPRMMEISTDPNTPSWTDSIISFLRDGIVPEDKQEAMKLRKKASRYTLVDGVLYKRSFSLPLLRCLNPYEVEYALWEVHEGVCESHIGARTLAHKVLKQEEFTTLIAPWPFAQWGFDLLGPFLKGVKGVTHLIVGVDYFTKLVEVRPLSSLTSKKIEDFVFSSIICRYGIPNQIVADNRTQFNCSSFRDFYSSYGIKLQFTSVYHPKSNGMVESVNKVILKGIKPRLELHKAREEARLRSLVYKQKIANFYNKRVRPRAFKVGDLILRKAGLTGFETRFGKLAPNWEGLYTVAEMPHPGAYILWDTEGKKVPKVWNVNNLKKFYP
ncbi:hypothetical protein SLEP1_g24352 [Rubroshorea leprosula]|uniref:Uncharacterized protein n=1 Tax=Rubroshorea leprosula TaxID=152421 RepID=A0AAV5JMN1_9ROSI|nr:hypothetical protein SLEP1_g24352 [Rubroshorea leprosula]